MEFFAFAVILIIINCIKYNLLEGEDILDDQDDDDFFHNNDDDFLMGMRGIEPYASRYGFSNDLFDDDDDFYYSHTCTCDCEDDTYSNCSFQDDHHCDCDSW